jgi:quercetin dioxygenase-like cupin family protein
MPVSPSRAPTLILGPSEGGSVQIGGLAARFMVDGETSGGGFALVEHPIAPRSLAAPMHVHEREDEYSYVVEGKVGVQVGDQVVVGRPGDLVFKPRGIWHAFWNPGDAPARLLEIISPAGFERYFEELAPLLGGQGPPDVQAVQELQSRYRMTMDMGSVERLVAEHGLRAQPVN